MASLNKKNFDSPDETMTPEKMRVDNVDLGNGVKAARMTTQPGWKWSECIKPMVGTDSCQKKSCWCLCKRKNYGYSRRWFFN